MGCFAQSEHQEALLSQDDIKNNKQYLKNTLKLQFMDKITANF